MAEGERPHCPLVFKNEGKVLLEAAKTSEMLCFFLRCVSNEGDLNETA